VVEEVVVVEGVELNKSQPCRLNLMFSMVYITADIQTDLLCVLIPQNKRSN